MVDYRWITGGLPVDYRADAAPNVYLSDCLIVIVRLFGEIKT